VVENCAPLNESPLFATSVYTNNGDRIKKMCIVCDKASCSVRERVFLHILLNDSYNTNIKNVDISDQLQGTYPLDCWMHKSSGGGPFTFGDIALCLCIPTSPTSGS
jgi:hypothetical protein